MLQWPTREKDQAVEIVAARQTATHIFELTEDGIVHIRRNEMRDRSQDPEMLKRTEGMPNYNVLDLETVEALLSLVAPAISKAS